MQLDKRAPYTKDGRIVCPYCGEQEDQYTRVQEIYQYTSVVGEHIEIRYICVNNGCFFDTTTTTPHDYGLESTIKTRLLVAAAALTDDEVYDEDNILPEYLPEIREQRARAQAFDSVTKVAPILMSENDDTVKGTIYTTTNGHFYADTPWSDIIAGPFDDEDDAFDAMMTLEEERRQNNPLGDSKRLMDAFAELESDHDIAAHGNFWCCGTCGHYDLGENEGHEHYVFWHEQADNMAFRHDYLFESLWLQQSDDTTAYTVANVLCRHGLDVDWNGEYGNCLEVKPSGLIPA